MTDRAERAFARTFEDRAAEHDFAPLDPADLIARAQALPDDETGPADAGAGVPAGATPIEAARTSRRRRPWLAAVAAAVALVVVVPGVASLWGAFNARSAAPAAAPALDAAAPERAGSSAVSSPEQPVVATRLPVRPGWRWESTMDVAVQVPDAWGYAFAPSSGWCAGDGYQRPEEPFVDRNPIAPSLGVLAIACPPLPDALRQTHLSWRVAGADVAAEEEPVGDGWVRVTREVGRVQLTVEAPADEEALANEILGTAIVVDVDPRGCPVAGPPAEIALEPGTRPTTGPLEDVASVDSVTVCQYAGLDGTGPNLVGSRLLTGAGARAVVDALGEPITLADPLPSCAPTRESLVLRINDGQAEAWLPLDNCRIPVFDTGASMHHPTQETCADLLTGPLVKSLFADPKLVEACAPR